MGCVRWRTAAARLGGAPRRWQWNSLQLKILALYTLACEHEWQPALDAARDALRLIRERGAMRLARACCSSHISAPRSSHLVTWRRCSAAAAEGDGVHARVTERDGTRTATRCLPVPSSRWASCSSTLPARSMSTLALLDVHGVSISLTGELHELRARLVECESRRRAEKAVALQRTHDCYTRFGMTAQAARVAEGLNGEVSH